VERLQEYWNSHEPELAALDLDHIRVMGSASIQAA
jgi:hypothetical protein